MSQCWSEGALRTYIDRELPPPDMELVTAHLAECAECAAMSKGLAARAARVAGWMDALPEPDMAREGAPVIASRARRRRRLVALVAALAAGLAVAAMVVPRQGSVVTAPATSVNLEPKAPAAAGEAGAIDSHPIDSRPIDSRLIDSRPIDSRPVTRIAAAPRKTRRLVSARTTIPPTVNSPFLALDDEPIETGVVMRVGVEPGNLQADIVFGQDGRAHAIRLVSARN